MAIILAVDRCMKKGQVAKKFGISPSTLSTILSKHCEIMMAPGSDRKRMKTRLNCDLDERVFNWLSQAQAKSIPVSGTILQEQARQVALKLGIQDFVASNGWLYKFKKRWNLTTLKVCGEEAAVDPSVAETFRERLPLLTEGYSPQDVFNADEAGFFYNLLPDRTLSVKGQTCHGGKMSKDRFTVLLCANSDGSEKLPPLVIGKFAKPRCFKNINRMPCPYKNSKNAWMNAGLFRKWLEGVDACMGGKNRKFLLFLDKCAAHNVEGLKLRNVSVVFFPSNCTSKLQPLDQGVISVVKRLYRKMLVQYLLCRIDSCDPKLLKWNVLQAMQCLCEAWDKVSPLTIANCFKKAGFVNSSHENAINICDGIVSESSECWVGLKEAMMLDTSFDEYVDIDNDLITREDGYEMNPVTVGENNISVIEEEEEDMCPKSSAVTAALDMLEKFLLCSGTCSEAMNNFRAIETHVLKQVTNKKKQSTILSYFMEKINTVL